MRTRIVHIWIWRYDRHIHIHTLSADGDMWLYDACCLLWAASALPVVRLFQYIYIYMFSRFLKSEPQRNYHHHHNTARRSQNKFIALFYFSSVHRNIGDDVCLPPLFFESLLLADVFGPCSEGSHFTTANRLTPSYTVFAIARVWCVWCVFVCVRVCFLRCVMVVWSSVDWQVGKKT